MLPIIFGLILSGSVLAEDLPLDKDGVPELIVNDSIHEKIYIQKPIIKQTDSKAFFNNEEEIFVYMNMHGHLIDKNISIYNDLNIGFLYGECDYRRSPLRCSVENNHWMLQPIITLNKDRHTISLLLYDEEGKVMAQSSMSKKRSVKIINQKSSVSSSLGGQSLCNTGGCKGLRPRFAPPQANGLLEKTEPIKLEQKPTLTGFEIQQAVMSLCLSVK